MRSSREHIDDVVDALERVGGIRRRHLSSSLLRKSGSNEVARGTQAGRHEQSASRWLVMDRR
jgi:hypothetical protein